MRKLRTASKIKILFGLLIALSFFAGCSADRILLGENHDKVDPSGARRSVLTVNGGHVECWVASSPGVRAEVKAKALVLFIPGKSSLAESWTTVVANSWGEKPVEVWGMNYPGSGGTDGPSKLDRVSPTALGTYDELLKIAEGRPIFLQGASFGTTVALDIAAHRKVAGVLLHKPPPLKQLILEQYGWWNLWIVAGPIAARVPEGLDSLMNAAQCDAPAIFVIHGGDEIIGPKLQHRVADAYAGPKRVVENLGARHDAPLTKEASEQNAEALDWLWSGAVK